MKRRDVSRGRGFAVLLALFVGLLVMAGMALLAADLGWRAQQYRRELAAVQLTALTDAGVALALAELAIGAGYQATAERPLGDGHLAIEVTPSGERRVAVVVRARYGRSRRAVRAEVLLSSAGRPRVLSWRPLPAAR